MTRSDAVRNRERILDVARAVLGEHGTQASLRDVARRAEVGLGTLYRHFPSRDALLETLTRRRFEHLTARADVLAARAEAGAALTGWMTEFAYGAGAYRGLPNEILATLADESSPLHPACVALRNAAQRLLTTAQRAGRIRPDLTAAELFALVNAVGWIAERAPELDRRERLVELILGGLRSHA
ncbi:TetR/AcrR family transcriptional regulator [Paractinoplanes rishiriensis]|uniref:TetR family transcriptional regulator n=1 Tax=Paractinoplanes rishiriensis TaxID=1050105 RepID=A0A919MYM5_9ACTN|nr:TetR/AcrR family transcriptional regulator [Actinoplanes rishiriensis]GIE97220.1 TetR family transcriptional regulator [Actinoplanes rishiriensis]